MENHYDSEVPADFSGFIEHFSLMHLLLEKTAILELEGNAYKEPIASQFHLEISFSRRGASGSSCLVSILE